MFWVITAVPGFAACTSAMMRWAALGSQAATSARRASWNSHTWAG